MQTIAIVGRVDIICQAFLDKFSKDCQILSFFIKQEARGDGDIFLEYQTHTVSQISD